MVGRRKPSTSSSMFGMFLLMLIVLVTLAGISTAIYLEGSGLEGSGQLAQNVQIAQDISPKEHSVSARPAPELSPPPPPALEAPPPPPDLPATVTAMSAIEPTAGTPPLESPPAAQPAEPMVTAPAAPQQIAALEAPAKSDPPPTVAPVSVENPLESAIKDGYWIEYGVYAGRHYAERLRGSLTALGLDVEITATHTPKGRPLLRVRSRVMSDHATARANARKAERALGIATLLHATAIATPPTAMIGQGVGSKGPYWVQFGAFAHAAPAKRLQDRLKRGGIATTLSKTRTALHKPLFLVRSVKVESRHAALTLAMRGEEIMRIEQWAGPIRADGHHRAAHKHVGESVPPRAKRGSS